jgi:hypothetical protein
MTAKTETQKPPNTLLFTIYAWEREQFTNKAPTHDWSAVHREVPIRVECVLNRYGKGRVKVNIVKLLNEVPDWLNDQDLLTIARVVRGLVAESTGGDVVRITADDILRFALKGG